MGLDTEANKGFGGIAGSCRSGKGYLAFPGLIH